MLAKLPLSLLSPAGPRARLSILMFHRVLAEHDPLFPNELDAVGFDRVCAAIASMFNVLPLDAAVRLRDSNELPARALCITFDDGYADNHDVAMPILRRHGLPATFFIATGFLDGGRMWNDTVIEALRRTPAKSLDLRPMKLEGLGVLPLESTQQRRSVIDAVILQIKHRSPAERLDLAQTVAAISGAQLPDDLMMTSSQVRSMHRSGMQIGAHTVTHPILAVLPADEALREIRGSRDALETVLDDRVSLFAYPNGKPERDYSEENVRQVRDLGFDAGICTTWNAAHAATDRFQLPRFSVWDTQRARFGLRMIQNLWSTR